MGRGFVAVALNSPSNPLDSSVCTRSATRSNHTSLSVKPPFVRCSAVTIVVYDTAESLYLRSVYVDLDGIEDAINAVS